MNKIVTNYEALLKIMSYISASKDPGEIPYLVVESVQCALGVKGCSFFLYDRRSHELKLAASVGLSEDYLNKGPISAIESIATSISDGRPIPIHDVKDDPRIQYPEEASREGICSILSVPIMLHETPIGSLRVYTEDKWEASMEDVNFIQSIAQISSMAIEMGRLKKGFKTSIEILKSNRDPKVIKYSKHKRTPYEGVPVSVNYNC